MDYQLKNETKSEGGYMKRLLKSSKDLFSYMDNKKFFFAVFLATIGSLDTIISPYLIGRAVDGYISKGELTGLGNIIWMLVGIYILSNVISYFQQMIMGKASQQALYKLRGVIFKKLQELPSAFFSQNRTGDLMSRINNDTLKLSEFLSESILRFTESAFTLVGIGVFVLVLNWKLGLVLLASTVFLLIVTRLISPLLEKANRNSSSSLGDFTSGVSEQLTNFKAIIVFDRRNFFEDFLIGLNKQNFKKSAWSNFLNHILSPLYDFAGYISQAAVLAVGVFLIINGEITVGILISFLTFALRFYDPLRWVANIFSGMQVSLASWGRINDILSMKSDLEKVDSGKQLPQDISDDIVMVFDGVDFHYLKESPVLKRASFGLRRGKTYALVGPTGGGKSTIASLMSRLYDPVAGSIFWKEKDMKTFSREELSDSIGVILQEPYLFSGTIAENIKYGNESIEEKTDEELLKILEDKGMMDLIKRFPEGLKTEVQSGGENISIGQKQLVSFMRIILRQPEFLILDEATANIDTVTEANLQKLIDSLPEQTTKVIIAHRLNTIKKADEILFVSGAGVKDVYDEQEVLKLLKTGARS